MSASKQKAMELIVAYDLSLEQQIVGRGSCLVCRDEELRKNVEEKLRDGDALEIHCLDMDPLRVMEESLSTAVATKAERVRARGGLQGLAKAFEVLEQASLNLYLGPWRDEYKVVKMYSGMFTHYIKPVLSMAQIEKLFGLLGYKSNPSQYEQLCLQSSRVSAGLHLQSPDSFLRLSCAFFLARCECCLLLTALGKHAGDAQWELSLVRERQKGSSLQLSLDLTKKKLEVSQPLTKQCDEAEMDLYTDEQVNGDQRGALIHDDESPRSLTWLTQSSGPSPAVRPHSNGVTSLSSFSSSLCTREDVCASTLYCQLHTPSALEPDPPQGASAGGKQSKRVQDEVQTRDPGRYLREAEAPLHCPCVRSASVCTYLCVQCNTIHGLSCALLKHCYMENHNVVSSDSPPPDIEESRAVSLHDGGLRMSSLGLSPTLSSSSTAMSSLILCDGPKSMMPSSHPITYHDCCNLTKLDPMVLCLSCNVFHSASCQDGDFCQIHHQTKTLGVCPCGKPCPRQPLVLCRYCGMEYCTGCWYRSPLKCSCGQTFDNSSPV
ncbi:uncharacterized protein V6R79_023604 [Siganus canaliculatus]